MKQFTLKIEGMTCPHCKKALETAIGQMDGVHSVSVDLEKSQATIEADSDEMMDKIRATVTEAGYTPV
jgi:copper chaperone